MVDSKQTNERKIVKSWKTTLCGAVGALGTYLSTESAPSWLPILGKFLVGLSVAGVGFFARDNGVTSEQAGAK